MLRLRNKTAKPYTLKLADTEPSAYKAACMASTEAKCVVVPFFTRYLRQESHEALQTVPAARTCAGSTAARGRSSASTPRKTALRHRQRCTLPNYYKNSLREEQAAVHMKQELEATLKASAQSHTRRGTPPLQPLLGGILSHAMIS